MAKNLAKREGESSGAIKKGAALLSGLLRCRRCGQKLQVGYSGSHGEVGRYLCCGRREERGSGSCFSMGRFKVDQMVVEQALEAIAPGGIEAALQASEASALADQKNGKLWNWLWSEPAMRRSAPSGSMTWWIRRIG